MKVEIKPGGLDCTLSLLVPGGSPHLLSRPQCGVPKQQPAKGVGAVIPTPAGVAQGGRAKAPSARGACPVRRDPCPLWAPPPCAPCAASDTGGPVRLSRCRSMRKSTELCGAEEGA